MPWYDKLFVSQAKKGHKKGVHKNGPRPYYKNGVPRVDPNDDRSYNRRKADKYSGGKGSRKRRTLVKWGETTGAKTRDDFIDKRANTAEEPVYVKITHYRRSNPKSSDWREIGAPEKKVVSKSVFEKMISQSNLDAIKSAGNFPRLYEDPNHLETRMVLKILDGDRLEEEDYEFRRYNDPDIYKF